MTMSSRRAFLPGLADPVVRDPDPFGGPASELKNRKVLFTIVGGRMVHEARTP